MIVHGGGCVVDELMKQLFAGGEKNGLRVTPADQIDIITGALAGTANKTLLAWAIKHQINAVGLSLADGGSAVRPRSIRHWATSATRSPVRPRCSIPC